MAVYTMEDWKTDGTFKADPGQEVTADVYEAMLNGMPPQQLSREAARRALEVYGVPVHAGFMMGEPRRHDPDGRPVYLAFGCNDYGHGKHYFYLGEGKTETRLTGTYYYFDSLDNLGHDNHIPATDFDSDRAAVAWGADHEAEVYKIEYKNGREISNVKLYDPWEPIRKEQE